MATFVTRTGIPFEETAHAPSFQLNTSSDANILVRTFLLDGGYVRDFIRDLLGYSLLTGPESTPTGLSRIPPLADPEWKDLYAVEARLVETPGEVAQRVTSKMGVYRLVKIEVVYRNLRWIPLEDSLLGSYGDAGELCRYVERREGFKIEASEVPTGSQGFRFKGVVLAGGGDKIVASPPAKLTQGGLANYTWRQVPLWLDRRINAWRLPPGLAARLRAGVGRINSADFDYNVWPAKSLYCPPPEIEYHEMSNGKPAVHIHFPFDARGGEWPADPTASKQPLWDRVLNIEQDDPNKGKILFRQIETVPPAGGTAEGPYELFDMKNLFSVAPYP